MEALHDPLLGQQRESRSVKAKTELYKAGNRLPLCRTWTKDESVPEAAQVIQDATPARG